MSLTLDLNNSYHKKNISHFFIIMLGLIITLILTLLVSKNVGDLALVLSACLGLSFLTLQPEKLLYFWIALFPIADYLIRYPEQQAIITFARVFIVFSSVGAILQITKQKSKLNIGYFEISWALFAFYALGSCLLQGDFSLSTLRTAVDGFILPLILFLIVGRYLNLSAIKEKIFISLLLLAYCILPIGIYELFRGVDLLIYPGGQLFFDGRIRPNGPFLSDHSYALISLILAFTILYWPKVANITLSNKYKIFWYGGLISAFIASLISQFRAVMLVMIVCLLLGKYLMSGWRSLVMPLAMFVVLGIAATPIWIVLSTSKFYQQRIADTANFSSRVVTYKRALEVAKNNPLGVGLGNYENYFNKHWEIKEQPNKEKLGELAQSTPHSNFLSVLAELGVVGFLFYLIAHLVLFYTAFKIMVTSNRSAGVTVILLVIIYAGVGLTLTSGYYYDLNLFFFCCLGMLLNRSVAGD